MLMSPHFHIDIKAGMAMLMFMLMLIILVKTLKVAPYRLELLSFNGVVEPFCIT